MANTPVNLIPYPIGTAIPDVPVDMKAMADRLEILISSKNPTLYNSGWIGNNAHFVTVAGWTISASSYRRVGSVVDIAFRVDYTGASFSSGTGNIGNKAVGTFQPLGAAMTPSWAPHHLVALNVSWLGGVAAFSLDKDGSMELGAVAPGLTVDNTYAWDLQCTYLTEA